jgi:hypothetical protein
LSTPQPPGLSAALSATLTCPVYGVLAHVAPIHEIVVVGGVVSADSWILIACDFTASAFPALSQDRKFTVAEAASLNAPV